MMKLQEIFVVSGGAALALVLAAACSGGTESPTIHGMGPGSDESPQPRPPATGGYTVTSPTGPPTGTSTTTTTPTDTTSTCISCAAALSGMSGELCPADSDLMADLYTCACTNCTLGECDAWCASPGVPDSTCLSCAASYCTSEYQDCVSG